MNNATASLARLERVDLRTIWPNEATNFTPWLAKETNLALLGRTLRMEIELVSTEEAVGSFSADIVAEDAGNGRKIIIENQLDKTNHTHLGQILTYAAGLDALTVVWIAKEFTDEHRAALEWLNGITRPNVRFFGLEIEVWKIDESPCAPKFQVVAKPNDWTKALSAGKRDLTELQQTRLAFWRGFHAYAEKHASNTSPTNPTAQHWMGFAIGKSGVDRRAAVKTGLSAQEPEIRAELVISRGNPAQRFGMLESEREEITQEFGSELHWHAPDDAIGKKIYVRRKSTGRTKPAPRIAMSGSWRNSTACTRSSTNACVDSRETRENA